MMTVLKNSNILKHLLLYFTCLFVLLYQSFSYCQAVEVEYDNDVKSVTITKEDILNASPTKTPVEFSQKEEKWVKVMEQRHFERTFPELSDYERLKNLEYELLGKPWLYTDKKERIDRLKIASSNRMIAGTALPPILNSRKTARRMRNDSFQTRKRDDVGLIDGFLRLLAPDAYDTYRHAADSLFYKYDNEN